MDSIRIKRGVKAQLPSELPLGELAFCTDTRELYVGMGEDTKPRPVTNTEITEHLAEVSSQLDTIENKKLNVLYPSGLNDDTDYNNITKQLNDFNYVFLGKGTFNLTKTIEIPNGNCRIEGTSNTILNCLHDSYCIVQSRKGKGADEGLKISNLTILCKNGIKIGDINLDILDIESENQQPYIMRCQIEKVIINNPSNDKTGIGIQFGKVFNGNVEKCCITGFEYGIRTKGCDLWNIKSNRIALCSTLIYVQSTLPNGTFGSQCNIINNDLLNPNVTFIRTSDRCINIENNYMETVSNDIDYAIVVHDGYYIKIHQNRIENANRNSYLAKFENNSFSYLYFVGNGSNSMNGNLGVLFSNATYLNYSYKYFNPIIIHYGNMCENGFPYNSNLNYDYSNGEKIILSPSNGGLCSYGGGTYSPSRTSKVDSNAFVLENGNSMLLSPTVINTPNYKSTQLLVPTLINRNTSYLVGDIVKPYSTSCCWYKCIESGTTSNTIVNYKEKKDEIVTDGSVKFVQCGVLATGQYKISAVLSSEQDNTKIIASFRNGDDVEIASQGCEVSAINKRKKKFVIKDVINDENISIKLYNTSGYKIYVHEIIYERI